MKRHLISFVVLLLVTVWLIGCGAQPAVTQPTPTAPTSPSGQVTDYASLLAALRAAGATVEPKEGEITETFSVPGKIISINGGDVQVFEYADAAAAEADAARVSPDGGMIGNAIFEWVAPTHFYKAGKLIVLYVGADEAVTKALEAVLGPQFADGNAVFQPPTGEVPDAVQQALFLLPGQFRVDREQVRLVRWEQVDWPNGCLGVPMRDLCTQAITPGYRIIVGIDGQEYEYRSTLNDAQPYRLLLAAPDAQIKDPVLTWEQETDGMCQSLMLSNVGLAAAGPCDAPHRQVSLSELEHLAGQYDEFLARFAEFEANTPNGRITFRSEGQEQASPAWQRALAAWALQVYFELETGRTSAGFNTVLAWQNEIADQPGFCEFLIVRAYGYAHASTARCGGGDAENLGEGWLENDELEQLDTWLQSHAHVDADGLLVTATGTQPMSESEIADVRAWAEAVYRRLAGGS